MIKTCYFVLFNHTPEVYVCEDYKCLFVPDDNISRFFTGKRFYLSAQ